MLRSQHTQALPAKFSTLSDPGMNPAEAFLDRLLAAPVPWQTADFSDRQLWSITCGLIIQTPIRVTIVDSHTKTQFHTKPTSVQVHSRLLQTWQESKISGAPSGACVACACWPFAMASITNTKRRQSCSEGNMSLQGADEAFTVLTLFQKHQLHIVKETVQHGTAWYSTEKPSKA